MISSASLLIPFHPPKLVPGVIAAAERMTRWDHEGDGDRDAEYHPKHEDGSEPFPKITCQDTVDQGSDSRTSEREEDEGPDH